MNLPLNAVMKFIVKLRFVWIFLVLLLELSYFFLESSKQFSHYYGFGNYIYFSNTLTARHLGHYWRRVVFGSFNFSVLKYLPFFTYFLCINLTVKVNKKRVYPGFTHRLSWGGSRKLTTFTIELFLIIANGLRRSLKIWQGSWIHFKFFLFFITSDVSHFISFYFERIFKYKPCRYLWVLYREYFECADAKVQRRFKM